MNVNVFAWIREGIRQSVLMGVSDALQDIGAAPDGDELKDRLQQAIVRRETLAGPTAASSAGAGSRPRRLGRSLKDLEASKE